MHDLNLSRPLRRMTHRLACLRLLSLRGALLLGWALLTPSLATAAEVSATLTPLPAPARTPHLLDAADGPTQAEESTTGVNARPLLLGTLFGAFTGLGLGYGLAKGGSGSSLADDTLNRFSLGMNVGFPLGLWVGGWLSDGEGLFWLTLAGSVPGAAMSALWFATEKRVFTSLGLLSALIVTPTLCIVGYALSDGHVRSKRAASRVRVQPLLGASAGQGLVGLQGSF